MDRRHCWRWIWTWMVLMATALAFASGVRCFCTFAKCVLQCSHRRMSAIITKQRSCNSNIRMKYEVEAITKTTRATTCVRWLLLPNVFHTQTIFQQKVVVLHSFSASASSCIFDDSTKNVPSDQARTGQNKECREYCGSGVEDGRGWLCKTESVYVCCTTCTKRLPICCIKVVCYFMFQHSAKNNSSDVWHCIKRLIERERERKLKEIAQCTQTRGDLPGM